MPVFPAETLKHKVALREKAGAGQLIVFDLEMKVQASSLKKKLAHGNLFVTSKNLK